MNITFQSIKKKKCIIEEKLQITSMQRRVFVWCSNSYDKCFIHPYYALSPGRCNEPWKKICSSKTMLSKALRRLIKETSHPIDINLNRYLIQLAVFWLSIYRTEKTWSMTMPNFLSISFLHGLCLEWKICMVRTMYWNWKFVSNHQSWPAIPLRL